MGVLLSRGVQLHGRYIYITSLVSDRQVFKSSPHAEANTSRLFPLSYVQTAVLLALSERSEITMILVYETR
jgi:hypothetical protein